MRPKRINLITCKRLANQLRILHRSNWCLTPITPNYPQLPEVAAKKALQGVALNPMRWAIVLGALASALQISLPAPAIQTLGLLG